MSGSEVLLGIDVGTSATKLTLIDLHGRILGSLSEPAGYSAPLPGWSEADPDGWWANVCRGVPRLLAVCECAGERVAGVGICGTVPVVVVTDAAGAVLRPGINQNDVRATREIADFQVAISTEEALERTGSPISQQSVGPKLLWLRRNEPEVMDRARHVCGSYELIAQRLTGNWSIERNWALESGLYDFRRDDWYTTAMRVAKVRTDWFGQVRRPADVVGFVTQRASELTGLPAGTPVAGGSADHVASAFSAGVVEPGDLLIKLGGTGDVLLCADQPIVDARLFLDYHLIDGLFLPNGCMASSGSLIVWFQQTLARGLEFAALDAEAQTVPPGADGLLVLPYFLGEKTPLFDPFARGTIVGLTLSHTRGHLFRAILEGIGFGFRHHLEVLAQVARVPEKARCTNGGARSKLWKQITADVLGLPLESVAQHPGSSLGAAFLAGRAIGAFDDWSEIGRYIRVDEVTRPDPAAHAHYERTYPMFREVYARLKDVYPRL